MCSSGVSWPHSILTFSPPNVIHAWVLADFKLAVRSAAPLTLLDHFSSQLLQRVLSLYLDHNCCLFSSVQFHAFCSLTSPFVHVCDMYLCVYLYMFMHMHVGVYAHMWRLDVEGVCPWWLFSLWHTISQQTQTSLVQLKWLGTELQGSLVPVPDKNYGLL